jgi:hypothetical protein
MSKNIIVESNTDLSNVSVIIRGENNILIAIPRECPPEKIETLREMEENR